MYTSPTKSTAAKLAAVLGIASVIAIAYLITTPPHAYVQVLVAVSPSERDSRPDIQACALRAVEMGVARGATIDVAVVSGVPAHMRWTRVEARRSLLTRMTPDLTQKAIDDALAGGRRAVERTLSGPTPPGSSDQLAALAVASSREGKGARTTVLCADGHWVGAGGNAYRRPSAARTLDDLRRKGLLPNFGGATVIVGSAGADRRAELPASSEVAIRRVWEAWARAAHARLRYGGPDLVPVR
jgi:hypothetical protein